MREELRLLGGSKKEPLLAKVEKFFRIPLLLNVGEKTTDLAVGFPVFVLAIALAIIGAWQKIFWLPALAALLSLPLGFYLQGNSDLGLLVWLVPLSLLGVAYSLRKEKIRLAWLLLLPGVFLLILLAIALVVFLNIRG